MTEQRLLAFAKAWSSKNPEEVMSFFTDDCVYKPSVSEGIDQAYCGKQEVRRVVEQMIRFDDSLSARVDNIKIVGEFGFWEWEYQTKGNKCISGCDVFKFRDTQIVEKNAFRKVKL